MTGLDGRISARPTPGHPAATARQAGPAAWAGTGAAAGRARPVRRGVPPGRPQPGRRMRAGRRAERGRRPRRRHLIGRIDPRPVRDRVHGKTGGLGQELPASRAVAIRVNGRPHRRDELGHREFEILVDDRHGRGHPGPGRVRRSGPRSRSPGRSPRSRPGRRRGRRSGRRQGDRRPGPSSRRRTSLLRPLLNGLPEDASPNHLTVSEARRSRLRRPLRRGGAGSGAGLQAGHLGGGQPQRRGGHVLGQVRGTAGTGNGQHVRALLQRPGEPDLRGVTPCARATASIRVVVGAARPRLAPAPAIAKNGTNAMPSSPQARNTSSVPSCRASML